LTDQSNYVVPEHKQLFIGRPYGRPVECGGGSLAQFGQGEVGQIFHMPDCQGKTVPVSKSDAFSMPDDFPTFNLPILLKTVCVSTCNKEIGLLSVAINYTNGKTPILPMILFCLRERRMECAGRLFSIWYQEGCWFERDGSGPRSARIHIGSFSYHADSPRKCGWQGEGRENLVCLRWENCSVMRVFRWQSDMPIWHRITCMMQSIIF